MVVMLRTIIFTADTCLKNVPSDHIACENSIISILTPEGWKIPEEGDVIKEIAPGVWNVLGEAEITELAYNFNNLLGAVCPIDNIEQYYIDAFGAPVIKRAVAKVIADLKEEDYNNQEKLRNILKLSHWILQRF